MIDALRARGVIAVVEFAVAAGALKLGVPGDFARATAAEVEQMVRT